MEFDELDDSTLQSQFVINPANGLPMIGELGGVDVVGNPYGTDSLSCTPGAGSGLWGD